MQALTSLEVAGNQLATLPEEIGGLSSLLKLAAFGNLLSSLPEGLGSAAALQELWLQGNKLTALPAAIGRLQVGLRGCGVEEFVDSAELYAVLSAPDRPATQCAFARRAIAATLPNTNRQMFLDPFNRCSRNCAGAGAAVGGGQPADGPAARVHRAHVPAQPQPVRLLIPVVLSCCDAWHTIMPHGYGTRIASSAPCLSSTTFAGCTSKCSR